MGNGKPYHSIQAPSETRRIQNNRRSNLNLSFIFIMILNNNCPKAYIHHDVAFT